MRKKVIIVPVILLSAVLNLSLISDTIAEFSGENADRQVRPALLSGERYFMIGTPAFSAYPVPSSFYKRTYMYYNDVGTTPFSVSFYAPVYVRNKAYITRLDLIGRDGDSDTDMELSLYSRSSSGVETEIATVSSSGSTGAFTKWIAPRFSEQMSGNKYYFLKVTFPLGSSSALIFEYARVVVKGY